MGFDWNSSSNAGGDSLMPVWFRTHPHRGAIIAIGIMLLLAFLSLLTQRRELFVFFAFWAFIIYLVWNTPSFLRKQQVIDRWDMVIPAGQGQSELVIEATQTHIDEIEPPNVEIRFADLAPGMLRGISGDTRPFLIAQNVTNGRLKSYQMFVNVRDYGQALQTSWYLAYLPSAWQRFRGRLGLDLDLFDEQDLRAYVTVVHHAFIESVIDLLNALGQDTNVNRTSKGFLGVS